jgi:hypothetical protein
MDQQLVIKLTSGDGNGVPVGLVESPPMLYTNFRETFPTVTFSDIANPTELEPYWYGVYEWAYVPTKQLPHTQSYKEMGLTKNEDGIWRLTWAIVDETPEVIAQRIEDQAGLIRYKRRKALQRSDFVFFPDVADKFKNDIEIWKAYRQQLRDLPEQSGFPFDVAFPEEPTNLY